MRSYAARLERYVLRVGAHTATKLIKVKHWNSKSLFQRGRVESQVLGKLMAKAWRQFGHPTRVNGHLSWQTSVDQISSEPFDRIIDKECNDQLIDRFQVWSGHC